MKILGIKLNQRVNNSIKFQEIITKHGCSIKSRIGLHDVENGVCSPSGIILLEVIDEGLELEKDLKTIDGLELQSMSFS